MEETIFRDAAKQDDIDVPLADSLGRAKRSEKDLFRIELSKKAQEAKKKKIPFSTGLILNDFEEKLDNWQRELKRSGYAKTKKPTYKDMDWKKYFDIKNWEKESEEEVFDPDLTKRNPGLHVTQKHAKYRFKGTKYTCLLALEEPAEAIARARKRL